MEMDLKGCCYRYYNGGQDEILVAFEYFAIFPSHLFVYEWINPGCQ
jgi:hypothetical protein